MLEVGKDWPSWRGEGTRGRGDEGPEKGPAWQGPRSQETSEQAATGCG